MANLRLIGLLFTAAVVIASWALTCGAWHYSRVVADFAPLEPRRFAGLTVVAVGSGGAHENPSRGGPSLAIGLAERIALVDAGRGVAEGLRGAEIPPSQPDTVYLTNLLPENTVGLDDLVYAGWLAGRREPLRVVGPSGTEALVRGIGAALRQGLEAAAAGLALPVAPPPSAVEVADGWSEERAGLRVRAGGLPGGPLPALAYRVEAGGRSAVLAGTGWAPEALVELARSADLLVHEAAFSVTPEQAAQLELPPGIEPDQLLREAALHTSITAVGGLAARAGVATLALARMRPPPVWSYQASSVVGESFSGRVLILADGDEITP